jgi:predicted metal-dependent HD superfamily phosphohydrolase
MTPAPSHLPLAWPESCATAAADRPTAVAQRLHALMMATCHRTASSDADARVLVDIDLAILGAPSARFDEYERQIRREYRWVPAPLYRSKRAKVLEGFLARPGLYTTAPFRERFEEAAQANLMRSLRRLGRQA